MNTAIYETLVATFLKLKCLVEKPFFAMSASNFFLDEETITSNYSSGIWQRPFEQMVLKSRRLRVALMRIQIFTAFHKCLIVLKPADFSSVCASTASLCSNSGHACSMRRGVAFSCHPPNFTVDIFRVFPQHTVCSKVCFNYMLPVIHRLFPNVVNMLLLQ